MSVTSPDGQSHPGGASPAATLEAEIDRIRASGILGAQGRLRELFDFLVQRSAENAPPKEAEIALEVFGKTDNDVSRDDPVARVYIHRLRKRLDDFYLRNGTPGSLRLDIPRGEYRIVGAGACASAEAPRSDIDIAAPPHLQNSETQRRRIAPLVWAGAAFAVLLLLGNVAAWVLLARRDGPLQTDIRQRPVWTALTHSQRPLVLVVGDYYIFGEYEDQVSLKRLVRDFSINSKDDLLQRYASDPKASDRYSDVALQYLPTSAAFALANMSQLLQGRRVEVILASELTPDKIKTNDVIYVGLLSGMGKLKDPVFAHSRFSIGESYDQIIDHKVGMTYTSEAFLVAPSDAMYRDYGFFSTFRGPSGNRIAIISGTRDTALMGVAEAITREASIDTLQAAVGQVQDFEAVFEVKGQKNVNLETRPIATAGIESNAIWSGENAARLNFPAE
jgi:hypothetical protein